MNESISLCLPRTKCENVRVLFSRIRLLFGVAVDIVAPSGTDAASDRGISGAETPTAGQGTSRLVLTIIDGNPEMLNCAKDYLLAACTDSGSRCERRCQYAPDIFQRLMPMRDEVERDSCAMVKFEPQENLVLVSGQERNVLSAMRYLDAKAQDLVVASCKNQGLDTSAASSREVFRQCRANLESEDSSYDSDYENADVSTPQDSAGGLHQLFHDDVSRTVSDTLAAEFAEYVTTQDKPQTLRDLGTVLSDPNYTSRVEFALKLGYTESQVQIALQKLGSQPSQNELLAELIKLGASCPPLSASQSGAPAEGQSKSSVEENEVDTDVQRTDDSLRHIVIDGSNVAMSHGNKECFSCRGIKLAVDWFKARGHQNITVFVPRWRKEVSRPDAPIKDQDILAQLEKERLLVFTPSRYVGGRRMVCYDDRYILRLAVDTDGIVVSNDNYKDLASENPEYKKVVEDRLLMYSFVNDRFMPPDDPLGRHGPSLDNFLKKAVSRTLESLPPSCPYGKKCTYGNKCKYYHPERGNQPQKSVTERLAEQAKIPLQEVKSRGLKSRDSSPGDKFKQLNTSAASGSSRSKKQPLSRTKSLAPPSVVEGSSLKVSNVVERTKSDNTMIRCQDDNPLTSEDKTPFQSIPSSAYPPSVAAAWSHQVTLAPTTSLPIQSATTLASSWAALSSTLSMNIPGAEMFLEPDSGGHLFVAKRLSDPDSHGSKSAVAKPAHPKVTIHQQSMSQEPSGNFHRKLQRQLSLNPACDPRLMHIGGYGGHQIVSSQDQQHQQQQPQQHFSILPPQAESSTGEQQRIKSDSSQESLTSATMGFNRTQALHHQPLARLGSEGRIPNPLQAVPHVWEGMSHQTVTRIASAPDANLHWPSPSRMQHLNSTSDTKLNMYPDYQHMSLQPGMVYAESHQHWLPLNPSLDHPRPMSPLGVSLLGPPKASWQDHMQAGVMRTSQSIAQPVRPSSVPPHGIHLGALSLPTRPQTPDTPMDARYKLEYHLSSIFPKEQVHAAMEMYPQETNPQKICAAILTMFPPKS